MPKSFPLVVTIILLFDFIFSRKQTSKGTFWKSPKQTECAFERKKRGGRSKKKDFFIILKEEKTSNDFFLFYETLFFIPKKILITKK